MDYIIIGIEDIIFEDIIDDEKNTIRFHCNRMNDFDLILNILSKFNFINIICYLESLDLETIPESIFNLKNISELYLDFNKLKTISSNIAKLTKLDTLFIGRNKFEDFPTSVCECKNLTYLNICGNNITTIPDCITKLNNITSLNVSFNNITTIPDCITKLNNITSLDISFNNINYFPEAIYKLHSLKYLDISWTKECIPRSLWNLKNLQTIRLTNINYKSINRKKLIYRLYILLIKKYVKFNFKIINKLLKF
jgi:Leucine-rich repeat (LRR) protein